MAIDRIPLTIAAWKAKLLDLTKRNRALNFKPNKVSTVTVAGEHPAEVFRILCIKGSAMKFKATDEPTESADGSNSDDLNQNQLLPIDDFEVESIETTDFIPYESASLGTHYTDDYLQTNSTPEKLDKSLRRIEEQARLSQEEQGVNTLFLSLGMLRYNESAGSNEYYKAPLILVPVELQRRSARSGYTVKRSDDEPIVNPSLVEYLKRNFGVTLPELPDSDSLTDSYSLQSFFSAVSGVITAQPNWSVKNDIYLSLFSFQKLVMYKDLERNAGPLAEHPMIRKVITRTGDTIVGLPVEVRDLELDRHFAPETTAQVVDADSSQLRAIAAVAKNHDLVLEGPPGTGKSQTITNLIAQSLRAGKSVLFVAEKLAALDVVHRRLCAAGLGEFCLELHSTKANKRAVMNEIRGSLDASLQGIATSRDAASRLPVVREHLTNYVRALHTPYGELQMSPYQAYGELEAVLDAQKILLHCDIFGCSQTKLKDDMRDLNDLVAAAEIVGIPSEHPWHTSRKTFFSEHELDQIGELLSSLKVDLAQITYLAPKVETSLGLTSIHKFEDIDIAAAIATVMERSPGAPTKVLASDAWNSAPLEAEALISKVRKLQNNRGRALENFLPDIFDLNPENEIKYVENRKSGIFGFLAFLDGRFRAIKRRWMGLRATGYEADILQQANDLRVVVQYLEDSNDIKNSADLGRSMFGDLWKGEESNILTLENYIKWVIEFRRVCVKHGLRDQAFQTASRRAPDLDEIEQLTSLAKKVKNSLSALISIALLDSDQFDSLSIAGLHPLVAELGSNLGLAPAWASFASVLHKVENGIAAELLPPAMTGQLPFAELERVFKRAFFQKWLAHVITERPELREFHSVSHEQRIKEFRDVDERVLHENRSELISSLRERLQNRLRDTDVQVGMTFLRRELARQRGLAPLRVTMKNALTAIRAIKPCFLMGPQTVAQLLDDPTQKFDLVIFDEASQLPTEEAVGAIMRGKQLVVVGDPKQLPPTNFFAVQTGQVNAPIGEDGLPLVEDSQSILEEAMGAGVPYTRLKWHYRSAHESLITFSNVHFYESDLFTFPSVESDSAESGLQFEYVSDGVYEGSGLNRVEARAVADEVVRHIKTKPDLSLGVGTFNLRQQIAIQDELEIRRRQDPSIEPFFDKSRLEPFFVKNLENIQGDERDVIFLSVTYAKAVDGRMRYNLGPLNGENGWRRLNVLTTRARELMRVFSSVKGDEINPAAVASRGPQLLKDFLTYAEHKRLDSPTLSAAADTESPFERQVLRSLTDLGYDVKPQIGVCGYRIDLGVLDKDVPGRFICGIECDGVAYHQSQTARDRDRLRQQVLEGRGWEIHRIWSTDWFKDRQGQIQRIKALIDQSKGKAQTEFDAERKLQESLALENDAFVQGFLGHDPAGNGSGTETTPIEYVRPTAEPYSFTEYTSISVNAPLMDSPTSTVARAILAVVEAEAPIHLKDLSSRVASFWGQRAGSAISVRISDLTKALEVNSQLQLRGEFVWRANGEFKIRSRWNTNIPAERIPPEEIQGAIVHILTTGRGFIRQELINEVRSVFGFSRTGQALQQAIEKGINSLLEKGTIGEGSIGIGLRR